MLVPYSKYQVVDWPFGLTVPVAVAALEPSWLTGPVVADGAAAAAEARPAATASRAAAAMSTAAPKRIPGLRFVANMSPGWGLPPAGKDTERNGKGFDGA